MSAAVIATGKTPGALRLADGMITYTSDPDFIGIAQFGYSVSEGQGGSALGTVHMEVIARKGGDPAEQQ